MPTTTPQADWRVWQDAAVAHDFTDVRRGGVYGAAAQFDTMLRLLECADTLHGGAPLVLDLGCGDGVLLETVFGQYPHARAVAVDGSAAMLEKAKARLASKADAGHVRFIEADFGRPQWCDGLGPAAFDAVISGFAIHHVEDDQKAALYRQVFDLLGAGGVFVNVEHVASAGPLGQRLFDENFARHLTAFYRAGGSRPGAAFEVVLEETRTAPDRAANRLSPVETQLAWLREIGFVEVDCYWKWYELAVLAGYRPA